MRPLSLVFGLIATSSAFAADFSAESAYASDSAGNPVSVRLGEPFWMTVRYEVGQNAWGTMAVSTPWRQLVSGSFLSYAGQRQATFGPITPLFDGPIPVRVSIGDALIQTEVRPERPSQSIEYYAPQSWLANFGGSLQFRPGQTAKVEWLVPKAPTFGFQSVAVSRAQDLQLVDSEVYRLLNAPSTQTSFQATVRSVREDAQALRTVGFTALKKVPNDVKPFLKAETLIESNDKTVKNLVAATLPKNFQKSASIYDSASALFRAVVGRIQYVEMQGGKPSAAQALRTGYGDCGYFSAAFVAACRQAGIPARPITGFLAGTDQWHVWAEFYVPGHGWVPVDPSYADGEDPQGAYPFYFGVIPNLNERVATAIGFDHSFSKYKLPILQSPFAITDVKKVASASVWCNLTAVGPAN
jgi:transglutaminase-like putative cysteine protease